MRRMSVRRMRILKMRRRMRNPRRTRTSCERTRMMTSGRRRRTRMMTMRKPRMTMMRNVMKMKS
jgi:hypothetical protein